jgi:hypothetical protein
MEVDQYATLRKRTTVMLPVGILAEIDKLRTELGISRSALLSMAAARFAVEMVSTLTPANRADFLSSVEQIFAELMKKARESA